MERPTLEQYADWAKEHIGFDPKDEQFQRRYSQNTKSIRTAIEQSDEWSRLSAAFSGLATKYKNDFHVSLFTEPGWQPTLHIKPLSSAVEKTYRSNVIGNKDFPSPPQNDHTKWITEENIFSEFHDLVRCRIVCRYMDGPQYICDNAKDIVGDDIVTSAHSMETELGYYAWHLGVVVPTTIVRSNGNIDDQNVQFEVQLTTHLNDVLNDLTHSFYEDRRLEKLNRAGFAGGCFV